MGIFQTPFIRREDRRAAILLYGLVFATAFNGYGTAIMSVVLADEQFKEYYHADSVRIGIIAVMAYPGIAVAQVGAASWLAKNIGRLWTIRLGV
jgi:hypothetical protein